MPHELMKKPENSPYAAPLLMSLRDRCGCANNEVLTIQSVLPLDIDEEAFIWTVRQLYRDLRFEVRQHIRPEPPAAQSSPSQEKT